MDNGLSVSDIAAVANKCDGNGTFGGSWGAILVILFVILGVGGFGGGWGNNVSGERVATQADIQRAVDFDTLKSSIAGVNSTVKDASYNNLSEIRDIDSQMTSQFGALQRDNCATRQAICENRYLNERNTRDIIEAQTAGTQKVLDTLQANEIQKLRDENTKLQMANYFDGIPRISPFAWQVQTMPGCGCCTQNI